MPLSIQLREHIESFLADHDLGSLYREYRWGRDTWESGFPDMRQLEIDLTRHAKQGYVTKNDIMKVAEWGGLRNKKGVQCPELVEVSLYGGDDPAEFFMSCPSAPLRPLGDVIKGMGPTYLSKVLMFSCPQLYGAIDTRLVRVFGRGDTSVESFRWLLLGVKNYGSGWCIPE